MDNEVVKGHIIRALDRHMGRDNAIPRKELWQAIGQPSSQDRKLRGLVAEIRKEGTPILFATQSPTGYYLPANLKELEEGRRQLRSYIIDECVILGCRWKKATIALVREECLVVDPSGSVAIHWLSLCSKVVVKSFFK